MSYSDQIRNPNDALNPQPGKGSGLSWWWVIGAGIVALILVAIFRPQWLGKTGLSLSTGAGIGGKLNPRGWV